VAGRGRLGRSQPARRDHGERPHVHDGAHGPR
jgi:hypothetical protein